MNNILIAFLVVTAVSLVAGILLALISSLFAVEENKKVKSIRAALPGINCGACGYLGCDDYAAALAEGCAKTNLCVPGAQCASDEICSILCVEPEAICDMVAFVHCNGNCEATTRRNEYIGYNSCRAASMVYGGPDACIYGCIGLGDCVNVCPSNAICTKDGIAHIDSSRCLGCGLCANTCPKNVISMVPQSARTVVMCSSKDKGADARKACKNACIGCKKCEKVCECEAISVKDNLARIDYSKCTGCGACSDSCPTGCLKNVFLPDLPEGFEI